MKKLTLGHMIILVLLLCAGSLYAQDDPPPTPISPFEGGNDDWEPVITEFDGVAMVLVPPGCFMMGSTEDQQAAAVAQCTEEREFACENWYVDEGPAHEVCFDAPFWIDRFEVTNQQFDDLGGQAEHAPYFGYAMRPRENITWYEAATFCADRDGRLPSEAEWEYAARGPDAWLYPWGNEFVRANVVYQATSYNRTWNAGSHPKGASWVGAQDMAGNLWEWTSSIYAPYPYDPDDGRENPDFVTQTRTLRGGGYRYFSVDMRAAIRYVREPDYHDDGRGFRCARAASAED